MTTAVVKQLHEIQQLFSAKCTESTEASKVLLRAGEYEKTAMALARADAFNECAQGIVFLMGEIIDEMKLEGVI